MYFLKNVFNIREKIKNDAEKPFLDHLEDLRKMFVKILITLLIGFVISWVFVDWLIEVIKFPLRELPEAAKELITLSPAEPFFAAFKIAIFASLILTFPFNLFWVGEFVLPGLTQKEKKVVFPLIGVGSALFLGGVLFAYYGVLPRVFEFFYSFGLEKTGTTQELRFGDVVSFVTQISLIFGLGFQLPVVVLALVKLGLLDHELMKRSRAYAIVAIFIISAIITPTPDALTLSLLAGPLIVLYEICIWLALLLEKFEAKKAAQEAEENRAKMKELVEGGAIGATTTAAGEELVEDDLNDHDDEFSDPIEPDFSADNEYESALSKAESQDSDTDETHDHEAKAEESTTKNAEQAYNDTYGDNQWDNPDDHYDPHHYDHGTSGYFDDEYHREDFKEQIVDDVQRRLREQIKADLRIEIAEEIRAEIARQLGEKGDTDKPTDE
ncbi:MAG: twin-arginine translocase subunit TatC [Verrucomicrobiota bacterium]